nr:MAG TPA: hypothetical protein [Caudoviricetes sp.]
MNFFYFKFLTFYQKWSIVFSNPDERRSIIWDSL